MTSKTSVDLDLIIDGGIMTTGKLYVNSDKEVYHEGNLDFDLNGTTLTITY